MFFLFSHKHVHNLSKRKRDHKEISDQKNSFLKKLDDGLNIVRKQPLGGVLKIAVGHLHAKTSQNTPSFTNSFTYNFQSISIIYCIFSNVRPKHLFQNWPWTRVAYSRGCLIKGIAYSIMKRNTIRFSKNRKKN